MAGKDNIPVSLHNLEDFIWMSYRYCIGRHTIASSYHASTVAKYVNHLSDERRAFMATDIRREISDILNFKSNFHIDGFSNHSDACSIWLKWIVNNGFALNDELLKTNKFTIDTDQGLVFVDDIELGDNRTDYTYSSISLDIFDALIWIKLANYLDDKCHKTIILNDKEYEAFPYYDLHKDKVYEHWVTCEEYIKHPMVAYYIAPEHLKFKE